MRIKRMLLTLLAVWILGFTFAFRVIETDVDPRFDTVMANRLLKTVESRWNEIEAGDYSGIRQQFVVLDSLGNVRYRTTDGLPETVNDAVRNRDAVLDVVISGQPAGKLIIHDDYGQTIQRSKRHLATVALTTFSVLIAMCALYVLFLNRSLFRPFRKLQKFALHVARGNLDYPLEMEKNNPFGVFTESFDMMREELAAARKSEYEANRSKKELVASLSHDIKTPVSSIKAISELMLVRANDEKTVSQLSMIHAKAEQINRLVTDMFHATLEELQELKVNVTEEYSSILQEMIGNVNYDDRIECGPIPECLMLVDPIRLQQVLDNVLSNSYKYAGTRIKINAYIHRDRLQVEILDYGEGVSPEELPLLFNKFYRGRNIENQAGAGLGLFISRYLMRSMQGDIECHNRTDGFTVTLSIKLA
ncbi:two-component sensor histidine kinase [Paenibacillus antibioticophila]|uniref:histidine kinase n=1 Tax=Paenibacillus antibioticophila TaxID=1274374 RepID=A0A919XS90_9BACL|nr:HAMP domain-containing sensor histidine kinase [Paenibacillus antibioticophila]GIO37034.1 two-component sensor histidine kinase [Paenibacillus antibioticophila]